MNEKQFVEYAKQLKELDLDQLNRISFLVWVEALERTEAAQYAQDAAADALTSQDEGPTSYHNIRGE